MQPYFERDGITLYHGDCREVLAALPEKSVSACVTSPPFWNLRAYEVEDTIWGGDPKCPHSMNGSDAWVVHKRDSGKVKGRLERESHKLSPKQARNRGSFFDPTDIFVCSLCGAWRGQYGQESTSQMFIDHTILWLRLVKRVLRDDGVMWLEIDDSRASGGSGMPGDASRGSTLQVPSL